MLALLHHCDVKHLKVKQTNHIYWCFYPTLEGRLTYQNGVDLKSSNVDKIFFEFQVLSSFEDVSLQSVLDRIKEKHNLQTVKKVRRDVCLLS